MGSQNERPEPNRLPRLPLALMRILLPLAERDEVLDDLAGEYRSRIGSHGRWSARIWIWRQVTASAPALAKRACWRGWSGFVPSSDRLQPGGAVLEGWVADLRYVLRRLRNRPTYATLTVLTLALGVAGTAAVYGIVRPLVLDPLPYGAEDEIVFFWDEGSWSQAELAFLRPHMTGFRSVAAARPMDVTVMPEDGPARLIQGAAGTEELFRVLGVTPALGPGFREGDSRTGAEPVAVLSHSLWREMGADPEIVGERIELSGEMRTVVGVMPDGFWFPDPEARIWLSIRIDPENGVGNYALLGRLPPGVSIDGMAGELAMTTELLGEGFTYPEGWDKTQGAELIPLRERLVGSVRPALLALLGAMAVILLIACVNVAALLLGQVDSRGPELAVRSALGASRRKLLQQIVLESLVIGVLAGLVATGLALAGVQLLISSLPLGALAETAQVDWRLVFPATAIALLAATAVALVPGVSVARSEPRVWLARGPTRGIGGRGGVLEGGLVVGQIALVFLLASGAGLLIRSVGELRGIDPGVDTDDVAVVDILMPTTTQTAAKPVIVRELVDALAALPGVESVAATQRLPLRGPSDNWGMGIEDRPDLDALNTPFRIVTPEYFATMGIEVLRGRGFAESDRTLGVDAEEGTVVINRELAERYFPGIDPIGRRISYTSTRWNRIVGVVDNVDEGDLSPEPVPARYVAYEQVGAYLDGQTLVIKVQEGLPPVSILEGARQVVQATRPDVAIVETTTMESVFARAIGPALPMMTLLGLLGGLALALGVVGVYGVVSHFVTRRTRELGIRLALGLQPRRVIRHVALRGGALVAMGIVLGLAAFLVGARLLSSFLYGVGATDPYALLGATALLLVVGLLAAYLPARRASRIDPAQVLWEH